MPTYDYSCASCGAFETMRRIAERDRDADCPGCGRPAPRVISRGPHLNGMESTTRRMMAAQERADGSYGRLRHRGGCDCGC